MRGKVGMRYINILIFMVRRGNFTEAAATNCCYGPLR